MQIQRVVMGVCVFALISGCDEQRDSSLNDRNGTSGLGTSTGTSTTTGTSTSTSTSTTTGTYTGTYTGDGTDEETGGGDGAGPDFGGWNWDAGSPDVGGGEEPVIGCHIVGSAIPVLVNPPFKAPNGYWGQGQWGACGYIALINANIWSGAHDVGGAFEARVRACLAEAGVDDADIADGLTEAEMTKIGDCKEEEMDEDGVPVSIDEYDLDGTPASNLKAYFTLIQEVIANHGSGIIVFDKPASGTTPASAHALTITHAAFDEMTNNVTLELLDPNFPDGETYTVVIDCTDNVVSVDPAHLWLDNTTNVRSITLETVHD
ncbi:MAG: hypothetical protein AAF799_20290 [Myxococcota bacterium]